MSLRPKKSAAATVTFRDVTKLYGKDTVAVDNISLTVEAGTLVTLLGPSGCGKTTTLRMIAGLEGVNKGNIFIDDEDITNMPASERDVSMVFQSYALFPHKTVIENVAYGLHYSGLIKSVIPVKAKEGLSLVGLEHLAERYPSELSGGQQQRVAVARALVLEPQVLLFDEPLSNLDAKLRRSVREEIRELQQKLGLTVVYVTHDQEEALAVSDKIIVMNKGKIAQIGSPHELYEKPTDLFVANFIGESNILDCMITSVTDKTAEVSVGGKIFNIPAQHIKKGPAKLAIRPEHISFHNAQKKDGFSGSILSATYVGAKTEYQVETKAGKLFVMVASTERLRDVNTTTNLGLSPDKMLLFND
ncbi:MAG: ABC transporter ATP-binding protein [Alphaproteobacteria bacterium]|nr:ABC transporter ATP-binding protein [Alphaproteobacteria bacterium]